MPWVKNTTVNNFLTGSIPSEVEALPVCGSTSCQGK